MVKGIKTRYVVMGAGAPILLVHGFGEFLEVWGFNIFPLSERYMVYAMDLPGHGLSGKTDIDYTLPAATEFIIGFMEALGIERASLIGHSLGGLLGLNVAINFSEKVDRLIPVDCGGLSTNTPLLYRLCALPVLGELMIMPTFKAGLRQGIKNKFYNPGLVTEEMVDMSYKFLKMPGAKQALLNLIRSNTKFSGTPPEELVITNKFHLVKSPTLFIHGAQDKNIPLEQVLNAYKLVPNARLEVIEECGHCPHIEKPAEFNEAVIAFLESSELSEVQNVR